MRLWSGQRLDGWGEAPISVPSRHARVPSQAAIIRGCVVGGALIGATQPSSDVWGSASASVSSRHARFRSLAAIARGRVVDERLRWGRCLLFANGRARLRTSGLVEACARSFAGGDHSRACSRRALGRSGFSPGAWDLTERNGGGEMQGLCPRFLRPWWAPALVCAGCWSSPKTRSVPGSGGAVAFRWTCGV